MRSELFSTRDVCRLTGMSAKTIRALAHDGVVGDKAGRSLRFGFRDLRVLRMARGLMGQGLSPAKVRKTLVRLHAQVAAHDVPLSAACCTKEQNKIVASDGVARWEVLSGQALAASDASHRLSEAPCVLLAHAPRLPGNVEVAGSVGVEMLDRLPGHGALGQADQWFNAALAAEDRDPHRAYALYMRAMACDPEHVEAIINVGRLCFADDDLARAAAFFRLAVRIDAAHPVAHFNLAVALHDTGQFADAVNSYRRALLFDRHFADAHYNLGTLLDKAGRTEEAAYHFTQYRAALRLRP